MLPDKDGGGGDSGIIVLFSSRLLSGDALSLGKEKYARISYDFKVNHTNF